MEDLSEKLKKSKKDREVLKENSSLICSEFTQAETQLVSMNYCKLNTSLKQKDTFERC